MQRFLRHAISETIPILILFGFALYYLGFVLRDDIASFGGSPGQFFRFWYPLEVSLPQNGNLIDWNPYWYAGYPELQFYPPGFVILGLAIKLVSFGSISTVFNYQIINFIAYLLPGISIYIFFRFTGFGSFVGLASGLFALIFPDILGGVGSIFDGMLGDRLSLGLFPLAILTGIWGIDGKHKPQWLIITAFILAAIVLLHPFQAVAPVLALVFYSLIRKVNSEGIMRLPSSIVQILLLPALSSLFAIILSAFWLVPLVVDSKYATPVLRVPFDQLDWWLFSGRLPFFAVLACLGIPFALRKGGRQKDVVLSLTITPLVMLAFIVFNYIVLLDRLHLYSLDPIRFVETIYFSVLMLAGVGMAQLAEPILGSKLFNRSGLSFGSSGIGGKFASAGVVVFLFYLAWQPFPAWIDSFKPERPGEPRLASKAVESYRLDKLWSALKGDGGGRILFTSSQFRMRRSGSEVLPTYLMALTPLMTGRETIGGTFQHWSPLSTFYWYGLPEPTVMRDRTDLMDDQSLFGIKWSAMNGDTLYAIMKRLNITTVVASDFDVWARTFLDRSPYFKAILNDPEYVVYQVQDYSPSLIETEDNGFSGTVTEYTGRQVKIHVDQSPEGMELGVKITEYPLWHATANGENIPIQRDEIGLMKLVLPQGHDYDLVLSYEKGSLEKGSFLVSLLAVVASLVTLAFLQVRRSR